ncbi:TPA: hypothetical protein DCQ44_01550 [Candidatus Taylorbacteria bacterium]|nr:hypothetical protein [Candidatus Taylorbacteria bacterium]
MKVYLFPEYITLERLATEGKHLQELLAGVEMVATRWDGNIASLPTDEKVIVRASTQLDYPFKQLALFCERYGHLCVRPGNATQIVRADDRDTSYEELETEVKKFLGT